MFPVLLNPCIVGFRMRPKCDFFPPTATVRLHNQIAFFSFKTLSTLSAARLKTVTVDLEERPGPSFYRSSVESPQAFTMIWTALLFTNNPSLGLRLKLRFLLGSASSSPSPSLPLSAVRPTAPLSHHNHQTSAGSGWNLAVGSGRPLGRRHAIDVARRGRTNYLCVRNPIGCWLSAGSERSKLFRLLCFFSDGGCKRSRSGN
ncbi:hypothetical protein DFH08DRAFT_833049 [Mycena albidolilacea]|uniref:Uncharacterized protein n=1 Tax=Mycena albidolilacea TaxID=1033008 RepID=A0AAD7AVZ9_9AGAR|nr:hypothetical protein DFH08DRAFT_833049 [Mycena albidolilacea]